MSTLLSPNFVIGSIRIGTVEGASCINLGNNWATNFENHKKHNQGFGSVGGDGNHIQDGRTALHDTDFMDMLNMSNADVPDWIKNMILATSSAAQSGATDIHASNQGDGEQRDGNPVDGIPSDEETADSNHEWSESIWSESAGENETAAENSLSYNGDTELEEPS